MLNSLVSRAAIKSRSRAVSVKRERNNLFDEVAELKRKLADVTSQRDSLRQLNAELLDALKDLSEVVSMGDDALAPANIFAMLTIEKAEKFNSLSK